MNVLTEASAPVVAELSEGPPGERYFRHPGDVVRLVVWGSATALLLLLVEVATATTDGLRDDLGGAATALPQPLRQLLLAIVQMAAVLLPLAVAGGLAARQRWRRLGTLVAAAATGAAVAALVGLVSDEPRVAGALTDEWLLSTEFPSLIYVSAIAAAVAVGKPWLSRGWRRAADLSLAVLAGTMAIAGSAGVPELALAVAAGGFGGAVVLVVVGAPNRRPAPAAVAAALGAAGVIVDGLHLERAVGGRSQLYRASTPTGPAFLKVYGQDSRDADLLYRTYRSLVLRDPGDTSSPSLARDVEHEALALLLAERGGVSCPPLRAVVAMPDGSMVLAMDDVGGGPLGTVGTPDARVDVLDAVWREVARLHAAGLAHGALRAANVLVARERGAGDDRPILIDLGAATTSAGPRAQAIDRAELLASLAPIVGPEMAVASAARTLPADDLAAVLPYLQPLALSAATRRATSKSGLAELRRRVAESTDHEPVPLERLVRVRPRTVITIATLTGAFYVLLPQLANVDDSIEALRSANWAWLAGAVVMSGITYVAAAIGLLGGVPQRLPLVPTVEAALASSFVNRVTPANVGGMALNVRFMQKAGVSPAEAVTGVGLNVIAGGIVHIGLLVVFFAWAGQGGATAFSVPSSSKLLVVIAVVLALAGAALATRWGRKVVRSHVVPSLRQSLGSIVTLARSPSRLVALFGGSMGVTVAYIGALACSVSAFDGGLSFAQVGAVYLGASLIAAAAPTPGGLGAMEAALVAGLTGVGLDPAIAVAAVLSYRLLTFWLPILPGWLCLQLLERRNYI